MKLIFIILGFLLYSKGQHSPPIIPLLKESSQEEIRKEEREEKWKGERAPSLESQSPSEDFHVDKLHSFFYPVVVNTMSLGSFQFIQS